MGRFSITFLIDTTNYGNLIFIESYASTFILDISDFSNSTW